MATSLHDAFVQAGYPARPLPATTVPSYQVKFCDICGKRLTLRDDGCDGISCVLQDVANFVTGKSTRSTVRR